MISFRQFCDPTCRISKSHAARSTIGAASLLTVTLIAGFLAWSLIRADRELEAARALEQLGANVTWAWKLDARIRESRFPCYRPPCWLLPGDAFVVGVRLLECRDPHLDEKLAGLNSLRRIRGLALTGEKINDVTLRHVAKLSDVEWLNLHDASVTDDGLRCLAKLKKLHWINVCGTRVTQTGITYLRAQLPAAQVQSDFDET